MNNILLEVIADKGEIKGYGEGAPRSYVTGESPQSATESIVHFLKKESFPWEITDVNQVWNFMDPLYNGKANNSAICALEMSLLDALGKRGNRSVLEHFPHDFYAKTIYYGAAIPLANKQRVEEICNRIKERKIRKLKLKMGEDFVKNKEALETLRHVFGEDYDLKVDVNGVWNHTLALKHVPLIKEYKVKVVEEPMAPGDPGISSFAELMQDHGVILMADESACSLRDMVRLTQEGYYGMINIRLSKCGGFSNSLKMIEHSRNHGMTFQIGCQLGESGLLSAGGRALSLLCSDAKYYDGSYDELLLKENITQEDVSFGPGGKAGPLEGPGLGVEISEQSLERLRDYSKSVTITRP